MKETQPTLEEFDAWDDTKEAEAITTTAASYKVRHIIKNGDYWALAPHGTIYKLPIGLSIDDFERLSNASTDIESIDALKKLLATFAPDSADQIAKEPAAWALSMLTDYGEILAKIQGASMGESEASSANSEAPTEPASAPTSSAAAGA